MDKNKMIIIALIVVIIALLIGMILMVMPNMMKQDSSLDFKSKSTLDEGGSLKIILTGADGSTIAGQTVNVTVMDKDKSCDYHSVKTDENGVGTLKLDKKAGKYTVIVNYGGNDKYKECNATKKITIKEKASEEESSSSASSSSSSSSQSAYAYKSDGTPMYSQAEVDRYMYNKYGMVDYHVGSNGYIDMDEPGFDDAGHWVGY